MSVVNTKIFQLDSRLAADTVPVTSLPLSEVLLINDCRYAWCVLVPRVPGLRDFHDLPEEHKHSMHEEIDRVSLALKDLAQAHKINVAALGNIVEQLHIHIVARHRDDDAWPGPVWGVGAAEPYSEHNAHKMIASLRDRIAPR